MKKMVRSVRRMIEEKKPVGSVSYSEMRVALCLQTMEDEYNRAVSDGRVDVMLAAKVGFKMKLPTLETIEDVKAYISCIAVAVAHQIVTAHEGGQLLYAAQLALSSIRQQEEPKRSAGRPAIASVDKQTRKKVTQINAESHSEESGRTAAHAARSGLGRSEEGEQA